MKNDLKSKAPYIALGVGGYICIKLGLGVFAHSNLGPKPYENAMNGAAAFVSNCLPTEGTLKNSANMMQRFGGKREVISLDSQDIEVIDSETFGKGSVVFWSVGSESFCQVVVKGSREDAESSLLLFLERSGDAYEKVELTGEQLAGVPETLNANDLFVTNSTNSVGEIMFRVTRGPAEDGDFAIFTAVQEKM
jgi:hypothetical protein